MLSERQERSLAEIENQLRLSDSRLASRFSLFAELVAGDKMPRREQLPLTLRARLARFPGSMAQSTAGGWPPRALLLLPVLLVAITCTLLLVIVPSHAGAGCARLPAPEMVAGGAPPAQPRAGWRPGCVSNQPSAAHHGTRPH